MELKKNILLVVLILVIVALFFLIIQKNSFSGYDRAEKNERTESVIRETSFNKTFLGKNRKKPEESKEKIVLEEPVVKIEKEDSEETHTHEAEAADETPAHDSEEVVETEEDHKNPLYTENLNLNGQFKNAVLLSRDPDCRSYATDKNNGDYSSKNITDVSNNTDNSESNVRIEMVIASDWNQDIYDYNNVEATLDKDKATHCRIISNMIPNHTFGVEKTRPSAGGWINAIDHSDTEKTYIPVDPTRGLTAENTPRNPPIYDFDGIMLNGVGIAMDSGFCYKPGVVTGPRSLQSNKAGNASGCGPQNVWFELPAYTIWDPNALNMAAIFDGYFGHGFVGTYHYHAITHPLQEDDDQTRPPKNSTGSPVIGFAPDGFPIYGHWFTDSNGKLVIAQSGYETYKTNSRTPNQAALHGTPPTPWDIENNPQNFSSDFGLPMGRYEDDWYFAASGNLDECNGAYNINGDYGYYITDKYPFAPPCIFGKRDLSFGKKSPTL